MDMLGRADRVVVGKDTTTIITDSSAKDALVKRIAQIKVIALLCVLTMQLDSLFCLNLG